jgi:hypothetical protein
LSGLPVLALLGALMIIHFPEAFLP